MKKKLIFILLLCLISTSSMTACSFFGKKDETKKEDTQEKNEGSKGGLKGKKKASEEEKEDVKKSKVDKEILAFSQKYLDVYDQEQNAFIELTFSDKSLLDENLWKKIKFIENDDKNDKIYKLIISCDDETSYIIEKLTYGEGEPEREEIESLNMQRGEFFVFEYPPQSDNSFTISAYKKPDFKAESYLYLEMDENIAKENIFLNDVSIWEKNVKEEVLKSKLEVADELNTDIYSKSGKVDLDGDKKAEDIYFYGKRYAVLDEEGNEIESKSTLTIGENDIDLDALSSENTIEDEEHLTKDFLDMFIIDIDPKDKYKEIVLIKTGFGPPIRMAKIYRFDKGELNYLSSIPYFLEEDLLRPIENKEILITQIYGQLGFNYSYDKIYKFNGEDFEADDEPDIIKLRAFNKRIILYLKKELNLYKTKDSQEKMELLEVGDQIVLLETDGENWIKVKSFNTGKTGYLKIFYDAENYTLKFPDQPELDNIFVTDIFAKIPMWG